MDYLGKTVRLKADYIEARNGRIPDGELKHGIVIEQLDLKNDRFLLTIDDELFGLWKAFVSQIEVMEMTKH